MRMSFHNWERLWSNHGTAEEMNKWEKLLLLNQGPIATQTMSYLRTKELKKHISGATHI